MPVVGLSPWDIDDNFGDPRDGGRRRHRGIDLFAPRGTELVAVTDGTITYIGEQPKAGRCLWLVTDAGVAFFYAHLDHWASGIYEGMPVKSGALLGYVGNTGNAAHTASHLHFAVLEDDDAVNPYPLLRQALRTAKATPALTGGFGGAQ
jgi:murein DD-endopeptidase MepM/ murein hydrolase activator NlpD